MSFGLVGFYSVEDEDREQRLQPPFIPKLAFATTGVLFRSQRFGWIGAGGF